MDSEELRGILTSSRIEIWELIDAAIRVASSDYGEELIRRRDKIVEAMYTPAPQLCNSCTIQDDVVHDHRPSYRSIDNNIDKSSHDNDKKSKNDDTNKNKRNSNEDFVSKSLLTPESNNRNFGGGEEDEDVDPYGGLFAYEQTTILSIKEQLEDPDQSEDAVVELLQSLGDMDITFQALQETDIGRHVNRLRKHPSNEVRKLVKQLVRNWKETVDEWVKVNQPQGTSNHIADGNSFQQTIPKNQQNGHHRVPDFGYSPNPQIGSSSVEWNYAEHKPLQSAARREAPSGPQQSIPKSASAPSNRAPRETIVDDESLNSASRRLQENYQEAQNAKRQRTIQVMDIHEIPKLKNGFFAKNKGGFQGRHHS